MLSFSLLKIVGLLMSIFSATYTPFVVGRFLIGVGGSGTFLPCFVLGTLSLPLEECKMCDKVKQEAQLLLRVADRIACVRKPANVSVVSYLFTLHNLQTTVGQ